MPSGCPGMYQLPHNNHKRSHCLLDPGEAVAAGRYNYGDIKN